MYRRSRLLWMPVALAALASLSCSSTNTHGFNTGAGQGGSGGSAVGLGGSFLVSSGDSGAPQPCQGLQCQAQVDACSTMDKPATTISGTVYDPAGALPLYNVYVYIPNTEPDPILTGNPTCTQCEAPASGSPVIGALTDANGHFTLSQGGSDPWGVPSGSNIPLVLQAGKWRRQLTIPQVDACTDNALPDPPSPAQKLRLPAKGSEGDMPLIAFTSGCDPAECFLRHIGIDDAEFVPPGSGAGHVHFYTGQDSSNGKDASSVAGGNTSAQTYAWWTQKANLMTYDIVFNACECLDFDRNAAGTGDAYAAMDDYLEAGGRLFTTHYYYNWFAPPTGPTDLNHVVQWALPESGRSRPYSNFYIDTSFPKGKAFADWLQAQQVTTTYGEITLADTRWDVNGTTSEATRWIYNADSASSSQYAAMYISFNSPVNRPPSMQCGRAVFSDVHLSGTSDDSTFPNECAGADFDGSHAINEKALEFLFFDLSSCVQDNSQPPPPPPVQ